VHSQQPRPATADEGGPSRRIRPAAAARLLASFVLRQPDLLARTEVDQTMITTGGCCCCWLGPLLGPIAAASTGNNSAPAGSLRIRMYDVMPSAVEMRASRTNAITVSTQDSKHSLFVNLPIHIQWQTSHRASAR
jgi:hypothetical protein